jgi:hypothetical protein
VTKIQLNCSAGALTIAAGIAPDYNLDVVEVAELVEQVLKGDLPAPEQVPLILEKAEKLRGIVAGIFDATRELRAFQDAGMHTFSFTDPIPLSVVASALHNNSISWLTEIRDALLKATTIEQAWIRSKIVDPRKPLVLAKMAAVALHWDGCFDEDVTGEFIVENGRLTVTPGSGLEFVTRIVGAANPEISIDEMRDCHEDLLNSLGINERIAIHKEDEEIAARRALFHVVE